MSPPWYNKTVLANVESFILNQRVAVLVPQQYTEVLFQSEEGERLRVTVDIKGPGVFTLGFPL